MVVPSSIVSGRARPKGFVAPALTAPSAQAHARCAIAVDSLDEQRYLE
jgi:hypothetical protein